MENIKEKIESLIAKHPKFNTLKDKLIEGNNSKPYIFIDGVPQVLVSVFVESLSNFVQSNILYTEEYGDDAPQLSGEKQFYILKKHTVVSYKELTGILQDLGYGKESEEDFVVRGEVIDIKTKSVIIRIGYEFDKVMSIRLIDRITNIVMYRSEFCIIPRSGKDIILFDYEFNPPLFEKLLVFSNRRGAESDVHFDFKVIPYVFKNDNVLVSEIAKRYEGKTIFVTEKPDELKTRINSLDITGDIEIVKGRFVSGFSSNTLNTSVFTSKELEGKITLTTDILGSNNVSLLLSEISIGDYIVHEDHGVGIYNGVITKEIEGELHEYCLVVYKNNDKLYVPLEKISKLTKYIGANGRTPKLTRLGSSEWESLKNRVSKSIENIAHELLQIYALRSMVKREPINIEKDIEKDFENDFPYTLTSGQLRALEDIYMDLNQSKPMDRLIVGDAGFGKTEVALRTVFSVASKGYQCAIIAPSTVLANQLYEVFSKRLNKYGFKTELFSRFSSKSDNKKGIEKLNNGEVHVAIGTHRLIQKDVKFKNLGLVVIDEEQQFGVKQKEYLKSIRIETNCLAMSATPIPRTLHMSLSGARDISVISTPPKGRKAVNTFTLEKDYKIIADIIRKQVNDGFQVYFLHNRISNISSVYSTLIEYLPVEEFNISFAHARMVSSRIKKIFNDFKNKKIDVLIATNIIENGLDIPNANCIFIDNAYNFGLAQLYQLRGRVGRSNTESYCYLLYPKDHIIDGASKQRILALLDNDELGSGFNIAVKDLEIRGAGNLLGKNQHGNVNSIGFELYTKLLSMEVNKLKV